MKLKKAVVGGLAFSVAAQMVASATIVYQEDFESSLTGWINSYGPMSIVNDGTLGNALNAGGNYARKAVQFTESTLASTGDYLELKFDYRFTEAPNAGYVRIGLFNDIDNDAVITNDDFEGAFIALRSPAGTTATRMYGQTSDIIGQTGAPSVNSNFDTDVRAGDILAYTFLMRITRDATGYTTQVSHGTQGGALSVVETFSIASSVYTYDTFAIRDGDLQSSGNVDLPILVDNISVDVIPEPATLGLVGLIGGALLFIRRCFMI